MDIYINCPITDRPVKTGIDVTSTEDFEALKEALKVEGNRMNCPECKQQHVWGEEAYIEQ